MIKGGFKDNNSNKVKISLVNNGAVIKTFYRSGKFDIVYNYNEELSKKNNQAFDYFRVVIEYNGGKLVTNPIFVEK